MDRPLDPDFQRRRIAKRAAASAVALAALIFILGWGPGWLRPSVSRSLIRTARVDIGPIEAVVSASGTVLAELEQVVSSPVEARVLRILKRPGDTLAKGDAILQLDVSSAVLAVQKLDQELALKENKQAKTRLDLESTLNDLQSKRAIKRLDLESLRAQLSRNRALFEEGLLSREVLSQSELAEAKAALELKKLEADEHNARESTKTQIEGLVLEMATLRQERNEARRLLDLATTKADRKGVLTWTVTEEGASLRRGDVIARIADLSSFRVDATVSDVHAQRLTPGLPVIVRISENDSLPGIVSSVHPTIQNGVITFSVALEEKSSPLLRSNLRADVLVVTGRKPRALRIKRGPFADGEGRRDVFVIRGGRAAKTPVRLGMSSFEHFEVVEGMGEGDEAIISDVSELLHLQVVRIR